MRLLEPITVGPRQLRNRLAVTPYTFWFGAYNRNEDFDQYFAHLERQAAGGVGMISLQAIWVPPVDGERNFPYDYLAERLNRVARMAHKHGAIAIAQSVHIGANLSSSIDPTVPWEGQSLWGFSAGVSDVSLEAVHEMSDAEIEAVVEGWGRVAELAKAAELDGLELHGGHGYLLHQSISPWMNRRTDKWGEPLRFWKAVLERVRTGLGTDAILGARVPMDDLRHVEDGGLGRDRLRDIAVELVDTGLIDYLNPSVGSSAWHYSRSVGTYRRPHGDFMEGLAGIHDAVAGKVPVLGVGRITTVDEAEQALVKQCCDFVGMTRAHIADPDIVRKLTSGEQHRIRPCVGANQCINRIMTGTHVMCFHNPETGREHRLGLLDQPAPRKKRVLVVGAGPAGIKAAEIAARRGHQVVLAEEGKVTGGRLSTIGDATRARELKRAIVWIDQELRLLDVEVLLGTKVDAAFIERGDFDAVVLATGSQSTPAAFPADDSIPVLSPETAMALAPSESMVQVMVLDGAGSDEAAVVTEHLATVGCSVTVVTPLPTIGAFLGWTHLCDHVPRLLGLGCTIEERTDVLEIAGGMVVTRAQLQGTISKRAFDALVVVQPRLAETSLEATARRLVDNVYLVGDAQAPRDAMAAFLQGDAIGRQL